MTLHVTPRGIALNKRPTVVTFFLLSLAVLVGACERTPHGLATRLSGLAVPSTAAVLEFTDHSSGLVGEDLWVRIVLELHPEEFERLVDEAVAEGYTRIGTDSGEGSTDPFRDTLHHPGVRRIGMEEVLKAVGENGGLFTYRSESEWEYTFSALDFSKRRLTVEKAIL